MNYKVFYRKYRPKNFDELIGQDSIKDILVNSIKLSKIAHAYIFTGPRGTGKTSTAKIFAKTLNCVNNFTGISCDECDMCKSYNESADIIEIDAASNNGVEEIRNLRESVKVAPYNSKYKIYIIDEVHMLSNSAWNAFLKTLEEPPSNVIFILATTEINKIPETVMSRCQRFDFSKIPNDIMFEYLLKICSIESINIDKEALHEIVKMSNGCLRDALSDLDKISKYNCKITIDIVENNFGLMSEKKLLNLYCSIIENNISDINLLIDDISNCGITPINFVNEFVNFLLAKIVNNEFKTNDELFFIKELVFKINNLVSNFNSFVNPFTLIKVELISSYFPKNNDVNISREINKSENSKKNNFIQSVESTEFTKINNLETSELMQIRINNSFFNASKVYKNNFNKLWINMCENLNVENNYTLLGYFVNLNIEVVSENNALFSFPNKNDAILFNSNIKIIEDYFNNINNKNYKFIALSIDEWKTEKNNYINNRDKNYQYIDESKILNEQNNIKNKNIAEEIFGSDIIEVR